MMQINHFLSLLIVASLGFAAGYALHPQPPAPSALPREIREHGRSFTSPLLECDGAEGAFRELRPFVHRVQSAVDRQVAAGLASHVSVYFRDLNNGPWFGIHEDERFSPASLLKVPILIAVLKKAETEPGLLDKRLTSGALIDDNAGTVFPPEQRVEPGHNYTIEQLIRFMITYSDNNAKDLLMQCLDANTLESVFNDLGIRVPDATTPADFTTVKDNASFLRILYNATYLDREMSERALAYLATSQFKLGLVAGVPPGIVVAHKFGQRTLTNNSMQLHDCGIVYYPDHPYLLCVMTRGAAGASLAKVIGEVSKQVYAEIDRQVVVKPQD